MAKIFMTGLTLSAAKVTDANSTDISGLLNLIEWCLFKHMKVDKTVLANVREARNT